VRLVNFLALTVVVTSVIPRDAAFLGGRIARPIVLCGQNSLYIFCLGILLAVLGHFVLAQISNRYAVQVAVNLAGAAVMIGVAFMIAWYKKAGRAPSKAAAFDSAG
jgi:prepilin signal peptidase PulO-like enzyme (type II secretory pathway)